MEQLLRRGVLGALAGAGGLAGVAVVAGGPGAAVAPVGEAIRAVTPVVVVDALVAAAPWLAEPLFVAGAVALAVAGLGALVLGALLLGDRAGISPTLPASVAALAAAWAVTGSGLSGLAAALGVAVVLWAAALSTPPGVAFGARRRALRSAAVGVVGVGFVALLRRIVWPAAPPEIDLDDETAAAVDERLSTAAERSFEFDDAPGLVSTTEEFYQVDVNTAAPRVDADEWGFRIDGAVATPVELDYDDLRGEPSVTRAATLRCISDPVGGNLMDTAVWTGVPLERLLDRADPEGEYVQFHAADGYYERLPLEYVREGLLVYAMNGAVLPFEHGYPARLLMPGTWGKVNGKWIERIEVRERPGEGYWSQRGWNATAPMRTIAKLWHVDRGGDAIEVGGHAYAGERGVSAVEVSVDGGETWAEADLSATLPDDATWRQWRHEFTPTRDEHEVVVRAVDGEGTVQEGEPTDAHPNGPTGWMRRTISR